MSVRLCWLTRTVKNGAGRDEYKFWTARSASRREDRDVKGPGQYCPVSFAAEVLGDRWSLLILREMLGGAERFNEIERCLPKVSRSLLSQRLRHLTQIGVIERIPIPGGRNYEYRLTDAGRDIEPVLDAMGVWAVRWLVGEPRPEELDPTFIMIWLHRSVIADRLPPGRTVVRFDVLEPGRSVYWLVLQPDESSVCMADPGFEVDVGVEVDNMTLHRVFGGRITWADAVRDGTLVLRGSRPLGRELPNWFSWSPFYETTRTLMASRS